MRKVGDLSELRSAAHEDCLLYVRSNINDLVQAKLIPASAVPPRSSIRAAWAFARNLPEDMSNIEMCRRLFKESETNAGLAPYSDLVSRIWLLSSPESVVESMASVIKDIFGEHRQLTHQNAALELFVRWNGPSVASADELLAQVQAKHNNNFVRSCQRSIASSFQGTVVSRIQAEKCHRAVVYK